MRAVGLILLFTLFGLPVAALADVDPKYSCFDMSRRQVTVVKTKNWKAPAVDAAYTFGGIPVLNVNFYALGKLQPSVLLQEFMYFHECARHSLGFVVNPPTSAYEQWQQTERADCWAVNRLYYYNGSNKEAVKTVEDAINALPREHWRHFPGPVRKVDLLKGCYLR